MNLEEFLKLLEEAEAIPMNSTPKMAVVAIMKIYGLASDMAFDAGFTEISSKLNQIAANLAERYMNLDV